MHIQRISNLILRKVKKKKNKDKDKDNNKNKDKEKFNWINKKIKKFINLIRCKKLKTHLLMILA